MSREPKHHDFQAITPALQEQMSRALERTLRRLAGGKRVGFMLLLFTPEDQQDDFRPGDVMQIATASNLADVKEEATLLRNCLTGLEKH